MLNAGNRNHESGRDALPLVQADQPAGPTVLPDTAQPQTRLEALLFGETQSRVVVSTSALDAVKVLERARILGVPAARLGTVGGSSLRIKTSVGEWTWDLQELHDLWWNSLARAMQNS